VTTRTTDAAGLGALLRRLAAPLDPARRDRVLNEVGRLAVEEVQGRFDRGIDPDGKPWAPLKEPRKGPGGGPLVKTRRLRNSVRHRVSAGALEVYSDEDYAGAHQDGVPSRGIPRRAFMGFSDALLWKAANMLADEQVKQIREA
jgi:phage virion morphogenesis protein